MICESQRPPSDWNEKGNSGETGNIPYPMRVATRFRGVSSSAFDRVWQVLTALHSHDDVLGQELDELRIALAQRRPVRGRPGKIILDLPSPSHKILRTGLMKDSSRRRPPPGTSGSGYYKSITTSPATVSCPKAARLRLSRTFWGTVDRVIKE